MVENKLRQIRKERSLNQEDIAIATGYSERTISRIERCDTPPSAEFMLRISAYLNLLMEDIFFIKTD